MTTIGLPCRYLHTMRTPIGPGPLIYAHRGASIAAPDNSLEAFALAVEAGADGIELDVRRSADGVLVLAHDPTFPEFGHIARTDYADIAAAEPSIPTLQTALSAIPPHVFVNVEIKHHFADPGFERLRGIAVDTIRLIEKHDDPRRVVISSFDHGILTRSKKTRSDILRGLLVTKRTSSRFAMQWARLANHDAVNLEASHLRSDPAKKIDRAHRLGLAVVVWTVDDPDDMQRLISAGVDAIITNDPSTGRAVVNHK